jgi:hypothetical protein
VGTESFTAESGDGHYKSADPRDYFTLAPVQLDPPLAMQA